MRRMPDRKRPTPFLLWAPLTCAVQRFKVPDRLKEVGYKRAGVGSRRRGRAAG